MNDRERLSQEIDKCLKGELNWMDSLKIADHTPLILQKCGLEDKTILFSQGHLRNCLHEKGRNVHWHGLEKDDILNLQKWLCEPAMIIDSFSDDMSVIAVSDTVDSDNLPIMACLRTNGEGSYELQTVKSNYLTSVYGRENFENFFDRNLEANFILYLNKEKTQRLESLCELPLLAKCSNFEFNSIIHKTENVVNGETKPILEKAKAQAFNQKWNERGFGICWTSIGEIELSAFNDYSAFTIMKIYLKGNLEYWNLFKDEGLTKWILPEEVGFYKNNPDVCDEWNEQSKQFHEIKKDLLEDIEYMFAPREDQMEAFNMAVKFIKEKMYDEYLDVAGYEKCPGRPGYVQEKKNYESPKHDPVESSKGVLGEKVVGVSGPKR